MFQVIRLSLDLAAGLRGVINPPEITVKLRTCRLPIQTNAINKGLWSSFEVKLTMTERKGSPDFAVLTFQKYTACLITMKGNYECFLNIPLDVLHHFR